MGLGSLPEIPLVFDPRPRSFSQAARASERCKSECFGRSMNVAGTLEVPDPLADFSGACRIELQQWSPPADCRAFGNCRSFNSIADTGYPPRKFLAMARRLLRFTLTADMAVPKRWVDASFTQPEKAMTSLTCHQCGAGNQTGFTCKSCGASLVVAQLAQIQRALAAAAARSATSSPAQAAAPEPTFAEIPLRESVELLRRYQSVSVQDMIAKLEKQGIVLARRRK
jgi:hypothetical protein